MVGDWSGLEKRPKRRNDTFAKTSARINNNMCIYFGVGAKKSSSDTKHYQVYCGGQVHFGEE